MSPINVFLADPDPVMRKTVSNILASLGCLVLLEAESVEGVRDRLQAFPELNINLVLVAANFTDRNKSGREGKAIAEEIKMSGLRIPVVVMSGAPHLQDGPYLKLHRPFTNQELRALLVEAKILQN